MRKILSAVLAIVLVLLCLVAMWPKDTEEVRAWNYRWKPEQSDNAKVTASSVHAAITAGWNLGNSLDSYYDKGIKPGEANLEQETSWGQPRVTKEQIDYVASLGFNAIRIPVTWYNHSYRDKQGTLHVNKKWLARVKEVVNYCLDDELYVFLDTHHDESLIYAGVSDEEIAKVKRDAASLWSDIATYFADADYRLIFESYNEVDNNAKYWQYGEVAAMQVNELNQVFVDTVRSTGGNNAHRVLMVPTLLDKNSGDFLTGFVLPKDSVRDRLLVTVHCYSQQYDQAVESVFSGLESFSDRIGAKVIIGEWGTTDTYAPLRFRAVHASNYMARATAHGLKCIYWDNGSNYALVDRKALSCNAEMVNAIMNPIAYISEGKEIVFNEGDFIYKTLDQTTGAIKDDTSWGTALLTTDGSGDIPVPAGSTDFYVELTRRGSMASQSIHYIYMFDNSGNLLSGINEWNGFTEKTAELPEGCAFIRIGVNSSGSATSREAYDKGFSGGDIVGYLKFR